LLSTFVKSVQNSVILDDLSNEDHCGPCGQYALEKLKDRDINNPIDKQ